MPCCRVCRKARTESIAQVYEQIAFAIRKERISCMRESVCGGVLDETEDR